MMPDSSTTSKKPTPYPESSNLRGFSESISEEHKRQLDDLVSSHRGLMLQAIQMQEDETPPKKRNWIRHLFRRLFG